MSDNNIELNLSCTPEQADIIKRLPRYGAVEEKGNIITHFIGVIMSVATFIAMMWLSIENTIEDSTRYVDIISSVLFGGSLILLFSMSTLYHNQKDDVKRIKNQKLDHLCVNILIAGSCSAFLISGIGNVWGYSVIGGVWALSIISMILNWVNVRKFRTVTMIIYIITGWAPILLSKMIIDICGLECLLMLLGGGMCYSIGLIFYGVKKKFMHFIWHLFVLSGSLLHIVGVIVYVL